MRQTCARAVGSSVGHVVLVRGDGDVQRLLSGGPGPMAHGHFGGRACEAGGGAGGAGNAGPKWAGGVCVSGGPWGGPCSGGQASVRGGAGLDEYRGPCESSHVCGPPTRPGHLVTARRALSAHLPPLVTLPHPPPKECWLCHVCTGGRQNKAQKMWLISGLQDHRYLSVKSETQRCPWVVH